MMELFKSTFGLGPNGHFEFFKYSTQKEKFVGFDQAYVKTDLSDTEFFNDISAIAQGSKTTPKYLGYFLQFKVVEERTKKLKSIPLSITSVSPFYGVKLSTKRDANNNLSQHELLKNISSYDPGAMVYYACPMLFDKLDLYSRNADLNQIVLVAVDAATPAFTDNQSHHIYFTSATSTPVWCSEPIDGKSSNMEQMFVELRQKSDDLRGAAAFLLDLFEDKDKKISTEKERFERNVTLKKLADVFYLIRYDVVCNSESPTPSPTVSRA